MQTQTQLANSLDIHELYDALMWEIEPELTTELLSDLEFLYEYETQEERQLRAAWYAIAFDQLQERMKVFSSDAKNHLSGIKHQIMKLAQKDSAQNDEDDLGAIERSLAA